MSERSICLPEKTLLWNLYSPTFSFWFPSSEELILSACMEQQDWKLHFFLVVGLAQIRSFTILKEHVCSDNSECTVCVKIATQLNTSVFTGCSTSELNSKTPIKIWRSDKLLFQIFSHHHLECDAFFACDFWQWETECSQLTTLTRKQWAAFSFFQNRGCVCVSCSQQGMVLLIIFATYNSAAR